jgi:hypothetical protein
MVNRSIISDTSDTVRSDLEYRKADKTFLAEKQSSDTATRCPKIIHSKIAFWSKNTADNIIVEVDSKLIEKQRSFYHLNKKMNK